MLCFSNSASYVSAIPWHYALQILGHAHMFWLNFVRACWFAVFYFAGEASGNQIPRKHHMHSHAASVNHMYPKVSTILLSTYPLVTVQPASPTTSWKSCKFLCHGLWSAQWEAPWQAGSQCWHAMPVGQSLAFGNLWQNLSSLIVIRLMSGIRFDDFHTQWAPNTLSSSETLGVHATDIHW
jgi:hypothetical protein